MRCIAFLAILAVTLLSACLRPGGGRGAEAPTASPPPSPAAAAGPSDTGDRGVGRIPADEFSARWDFLLGRQYREPGELTELASFVNQGSAVVDGSQYPSSAQGYRYGVSLWGSPLAMLALLEEFAPLSSPGIPLKTVRRVIARPAAEGMTWLTTLHPDRTLLALVIRGGGEGAVRGAWVLYSVEGVLKAEERAPGSMSLVEDYEDAWLRQADLR